MNDNDKTWAIAMMISFIGLTAALEIIKMRWMG